MTAFGLDEAVRRVLESCLAVRAGEDVLVVTDPRRRAIGEALVAGARDMGAETMLLEMSERETNGTEPPGVVAAAMRASDVVVAPTTKSLTHTEARHVASQAGARIATMPEVTEDMLVRVMQADHDAVRRRSRAVASLLTAGRTVTITSEAGTDLTLSIEGRRGMPDDGDLRGRGSCGNLPAGESFVAPVEGVARGRIVFDGSIWPLGLLPEPLVVDVSDGYATAFGGPCGDDFRAILEPHGRDAFALAELGIGTNEAAQLTGNVLEDEKILGTIHIAFGDNHSFGGKVRVESHQDGVVLRPTVTIDDAVLLDAGRLLV
ncbi:MAG TPA: aminopeptidase [Actinomycetota bacterium]|nr:aminopeptidase [Actinomycetota bacterium]